MSDRSFLAAVRTKLSAMVGSGPSSAGEEKLKPMLDHYLTSQAIGGAILERRPFLASRLGWLESYCIGTFLETGSATEDILQKVWLHAGVFPATREQFEKFASTYLDALSAADVLGLMNAPFESSLIKTRCPEAGLSDLGSLEPYLGPSPWSRHLEGRNVLVVHPFTQSIEDQYRAHRTELFTNKDVLPAFNLQTLKPPQTLGRNTEGFSTWSDSLEALTAKIAALNFDVAIVGCGAYGLPVGAFIKRLGKPCIHLGGATQLLFGITGTRWRTQPVFRALQTKAWRSPAESERPANWEKIENGCYW